MKTKLTPFGKLTRILRLENDIKSKDMATSLDVSIAYLSAVETGKKKLTESFTEKVATYFSDHVTNVSLDNIYEAADLSRSEFTINVNNSTSDESRELVAQFARKFPSLTENKVATEKLMSILKEIE